RGDVRGESRVIVGMHAPEPVVRIAADLALGEAEHALPARRQVDAVSDEVPVPEAVVRAAGGEGIALLALAQRVLRPAPLADVEQRADHRRTARKLGARAVGLDVYRRPVLASSAIRRLE